MDLEPSNNNCVSMIVVNYNAGVLLAGCVDQGLKQVMEVIVVDNASTDGSLEKLESFFPDDRRLIIIRNDTNLGFAAACNIGSEAAREKYLLFMNPDSLLADRSVEKLIAPFANESNLGMTGGFLINPDGTEQGGGRRAVPTPWRTFVRASGLTFFSNRWPRLFFDFYLHKQPLPDLPLEVEAISGACMMINHDVMQKVGLWDEQYFLHCEDLDLCMRVRQQGLKILFVPDAPVIHYLGVCGRNRPIFVEWHKHKGMIRFYRKFFSHQYPGALMWLVTSGVWLRFAGVSAYYALRHIGYYTLCRVEHRQGFER